jgi:hypothetical protein
MSRAMSSTDVWVPPTASPPLPAGSGQPPCSGMAADVPPLPPVPPLNHSVTVAYTAGGMPYLEASWTPTTEVWSVTTTSSMMSYGSNTPSPPRRSSAPHRSQPGSQLVPAPGANVQPSQPTPVDSSSMMRTGHAVLPSLPLAQPRGLTSSPTPTGQTVVVNLRDLRVVQNRVDDSDASMASSSSSSSLSSSSSSSSRSSVSRTPTEQL